MITKIKEDLQKARISDDIIRTSLLKVLVGEIQLIQSRTTVTITNEEVIAIIKKFRKNAEEMKHHGDKYAVSEIAILNEYLEDEMTVDQVVEKIKGDSELIGMILTAQNPMRYIKDIKERTGADGKTIKDAILYIINNY